MRTSWYYLLIHLLQFEFHWKKIRNSELSLWSQDISMMPIKHLLLRGSSSCTLQPQMEQTLESTQERNDDDAGNSWAGIPCGCRSRVDDGDGAAAVLYTKSNDMQPTCNHSQLYSFRMSIFQMENLYLLSFPSGKHLFPYACMCVSRPDKWR